AQPIAAAHYEQSSNLGQRLQQIKLQRRAARAMRLGVNSICINSSGSQQLCSATAGNGPLRSPTPATHESTVGQHYDEVSSIQQWPSREQLEQQQQLNQALVKISGEQFSGEVAHDRGLQSRA
ncbi:hypothetical protein Dimus_005820, partial [Dionaea muscipula]